MPDCCETKETLCEIEKPTVRHFVRQKALTFKTMLEPFCLTPEQKQFLTKYNENDIESLVKTHLALLYSTGTLSVAQQAIVNNLSIEDEAIKVKIGRYLECFCECIL